MKKCIWKLSFTCPQGFEDEFADFLGETADAVSVTAPPRKSKALIEAIYQKRPDAHKIRTSLILLSAIKNIEKSYKSRKGIVNNFKLVEIANLDWIRKVSADFPPLEIARWTVYGSAYRKVAGNKPLSLQIDATSAFGTGEHPTTRGCLIMLDRLLKNSVKNPPKNMLDVGCGSGILAMSFAKASGGKATGVEIDTLSASIAKENVINNKLEKFVRIVKGDAYKSKTVVKSAPYDLIMANIFAEPLRKMAKDLKRNLKPDGTAILSGLLNSQANDVIAAHAKVGLEPIKQIKIGEWSVLALKRV